MVSLHTINASEACGRETGHNAHCASLRAYRVARHYDDALWSRASVAPNLRWHGTRNLEPRERTDDAWFIGVAILHLNRLLAREREGATPDAGDYAARRVAVHYRIKNAPWV